MGNDRFNLDGEPASKILEEEINREKWQQIKQARIEQAEQIDDLVE